MTPKEALALIEEGKTKDIAYQIRMANTIAVAAAKWAHDSISRDARLFGEIQKLRKEVFGDAQPAAASAAAGTEPAEAPAAGGAPAPAPAPRANGGGRRMAADGTPMTAEEAALEDQMDAAVQAGANGNGATAAHAPVPPQTKAAPAGAA